MPRKQDSAGNGTPREKTRKKKKDQTIHPSLDHMRSACVSIDDGEQKLSESELANTSGDRFMLYRVGPKSITKGMRLYLQTFNYTPTLDEIKELYGGGEFWIQVFSNGSYAEGSPRIAIEGEPKVVQDVTPGKEIDALPQSSDPVVNILMQTVMQFQERIVAEIKDIRSMGAQSSGLTPDRLRDLIAVATEAQLTNQLVLMATGTGDKSADADREAMVDRRLKSTLEIFKMGFEAANQRDGGDGSDGFLGSVGPLIEKIVSGPLMGNVPTDHADPRTGIVTVPGQVAAADQATAAAIYPSQTEKDRIELEAKINENRKGAAVAKLRKAVCAMLDAFEADTDYKDEEVCRFVLKVVNPDELWAISQHARIDFDNVRGLMEHDPANQISLDDNRDRVEAILEMLATKYST